MEAIPLSLAALAMNLLGLPGLIFIIWHFDSKRMTKQREDDERRFQRYRAEQKDHLARVLDQYRADMLEQRRMYDNNIDLVKSYNRLADDLTGVITLSTQTLQALVGKIDNNQFCPLVRRESGK